MRNRLLLRTVIFASLCLMMAARARAAEKEVSFTTEDGWVISGMFSAPEVVKEKAPAVIFLHALSHDRDAYGQYLYPGLAQIIGGRGVSTLRIDLRGRGKSMGAKERHSFNREEVSKLYLDVRAAIAFLSAQPGVDAARLGIVAEEASADAAILGWSGDPRIKAITLISGNLSETAKAQLAAYPLTPLLLIVSREDRRGLRDMADAYKLTGSESSRIKVYRDVGIGTTMFSVWRSEHPKERPIEEEIAEWIAERFKSIGAVREISFQTEDGWTLYGTLRTPARAIENAPAPGVILLHSSFTTHHIFDQLAELMVSRGLAVLNFDTRGRGKSTGKGEFITLPLEERSKGILDAKAAMAFLSSQPGVKGIGLLGTDRGANNALASASDSRVRALVIMTTVLDAKEKEEIKKLDIPIFYVASKGIDVATKSLAEAYAATKNRGSRMLVFNGGALGYEIFELDENLEPTIAQWMMEQLSK